MKKQYKQNTLHHWYLGEYERNTAAAFSLSSMELCDRGVLPSTDFYLEIFL